VAKHTEARQKRLRRVQLCPVSRMKNFVGGFIAVIIGSLAITILLQLPPPSYPEPFNDIWYILAGSSALQKTLLSPATAPTIILYFVSWIIIGLIIGMFSKPGWNTLRSAIWVGLICAIFALISLLLLKPDFWNSSSRNIELLLQFSTSLVLSVLSLFSGVPIAMIVERLGIESEMPIPSKIETICECGAVFKSKPLMCSECGRPLNLENE
jgi:hypothetical protein